MTESELYRELGALTKVRDRWEESIPYVSSLLAHESVRIQAKALWLLGEMGLGYPGSVRDALPAVTAFLDSPVPLLRERAVNALGRIGRGSFPLIEAYWSGLFCFASDEEANVRLSFIWASENIATNTPAFMKIICRCLKSFWAIRTAGCAWKRRRSSACWGNAGPSSSDPIWSSCGRYPRPTATAW